MRTQPTLSARSDTVPISCLRSRMLVSLCLPILAQLEVDTLSYVEPDSKISLVRLRGVIVEEILEVVFFADVFDRLLRDAAIAAHGRPRLIEGAGIVHREDRFHHRAAFDDAPAFHDMHLVGVRRAVNIGGGLVAEA